ncbi:MAG: pantoate--beta-alanine ligase [Anaerolineales bacterium]|nr:pantoate--beta-alanine ligase [Anaerolineales bacterium]
MVVTDNISKIREIRWADPAATWGLVPTMGYLHSGHLALVAAAAAENDFTAVTIYVNPTQFAPTEDLSSYPRDLERDLSLLEAAGVDLVFTPSDAVMYPDGFQTKVEVTELSQRQEGASRPTHFAGVTLIVAKLFNIIQPTRAYFGQKDAQQTIVLKRMVGDLNFNLELIVRPTVREADGLAMSSRNKYLSPEQREAAVVLHHALTLAERMIADGERDANKIRTLMTERIAAEPLARLDYISIADRGTLEEIDTAAGEILISLAVFFGQTRLIDNVMIDVGEGES